MQNSIQDRFIELFKGSDRSFGKRTPQGRYINIKGGAKIEDYHFHLNGTMGLVICPINSDNVCTFGAIDIDTPKDKKNPRPVDHRLLAAQIEARGLPLVLCITKSLGAHLYSFVQEPMKAVTMRKRLAAWAAQLGFGGSEIFPKQIKFVNEDHMGSCINLPYFNGEERKAYDRNGELTMEQFVEKAEQIRSMNHKVARSEESLHEAPPCLNYLYKTGLSQSGRNLGLFNFGLYFKAAFPENWEDKLVETNSKLCDPPLPNREVQTIVKSLANREYKYKCKEDPIRSFCNSSYCKTKEYGIQGDASSNMAELMIGGLTKIETKPPSWTLEICGVDIKLTTEELTDYRQIRKLCIENLNIVVPPCKNEEWMNTVSSLMETLVKVEAPTDTNAGALIIDALQDFISAGVTAESKEMVLYGPAPYTHQGKKYIIFRASQFIAYCKRKRIELPRKNNEIWMMLRDVCGYKKVRVNNRIIQVWYTDYPEVDTNVFPFGYKSNI